MNKETNKDNKSSKTPLQIRFKNPKIFNFPPKDEIDNLINSGIDNKNIQILEKMLHKNFETGMLSGSNASKTYRYQSKSSYGSNSFNQLKKAPDFYKLLKNNFKDPILLTLFGLAILSAVVCFIKIAIKSNSFSKYDFIDSIVILIGITILGFYGACADYKYSREDQQIDSKEFEYPILINKKIETCLSCELVVGDLIILNAGDEIPCDCLILPYLEQTTRLEVDESLITGESDSVIKGKYDILLAGTYCLSGIAKCLVINVGMNTKKGKLLLKLSVEDETTKNFLHMKASQLLQKIIRLTCLIGGFLLIGNVALNIKKIKISGFTVIINFIMEVISFGALAIPEGLPFILTLSTSSARNILFRGDVSVRVKTKKALDSLISLKILCFDKTGTLTHNILKLTSMNLELKNSTVILGENRFNKEFENLSKNIPLLRQKSDNYILTDFMLNEISENYEYLKHLYTTRINLIVNNNAVKSTVGKETIGNKLDVANLNVFSDHEISYVRMKYEKIRVFPISSENKCMITIVKVPEEDSQIFSEFNYILLLKGASELISDLKDLYIVEPENICIKNISCAWVPIINVDNLIEKTDMEIYQYAINSIRNNITTISFEDPLRVDAKDSIEKIKNAGVQCIIVTGDSLEAGSLCAKKTGLLVNPTIVNPYKRSDRKNLLEIDDIILDSTVFRTLSHAEIRIIIPKLRVLARCTAEDKERLIKILKECNIEYSIGICGDGINDVLAMKRADLSFSFSNCSSQIPKNASSIILEKSYLKGIVKSLEVSRSSLRNIRGFLQFQISAAASMVLISIMSIFLSFNLPENKQTYEKDYMPEFMTSIEILWLNFFVDGLACFFYGSISPDKSLLKRDPEEKAYKLVLHRMKSVIKFNAVFNFLTFLILHFCGVNRVVSLLHFLNNILIMSVFGHKIYAQDNNLKNFFKNWLSVFSILFYFTAQLLLTIFCSDYFGYKIKLLDFVILIALITFSIFARICFISFTDNNKFF
ncbi:Calcium-transporting ATPase PAT1 [Cucumispora dikerogammari]|nr:Calcium-transporting ATPase PAT1 [Cucumispora dikerogammari]